jgi:hypothetical protein
MFIIEQFNASQTPTPKSRALLEKPIANQLVNKFLSSMEREVSLSSSKTACHQILP